MQRAIVAVIIVNAVTLGLETSTAAMAGAGGLILAIDRLCLAIFVVELSVKMLAQGRAFWREPWNVFDFLVVAVALVPGAGPLAVLRTLRVLRVLRLVSMLPRLRFIVEALLAAVPGIGSIAMLLGLIFYVFAVMATSLFKASFPEWFGSIPASLYMLFQVMTLDGWSSGVVRPVMEVYPWAWAFFVPFVLVSSFTMLNLFIAVIVDTMQALHQRTDSAPKTASTDDVLDEVRELRAELAALRRDLAGSPRDS